MRVRGEEITRGQAAALEAGDMVQRSVFRRDQRGNHALLITGDDHCARFLFVGKGAVFCGNRPKFFGGERKRVFQRVWNQAEYIGVIAFQTARVIIKPIARKFETVPEVIDAKGFRFSRRQLFQMRIGVPHDCAAVCLVKGCSKGGLRPAECIR